MPPISTTSGTPLDKKALKRPDGFTTTTQGLLEGAHNNGTKVMILLGILFLMGLGVTLMMNRRDAKSMQARDAFFRVQQSMDKENSALAAAEPKTAAPTTGTLSKTPAPAAPKDKAPDVSFKKVDVDAKYPETVKGLKDVISQYDGTRSAYEARMTLGNLYYDHGDAAKSVPYFEASVGAAPGSTEKLLSYYALGYSQENSGKYADAIQSYEKAMNQGELNLKGELLLGIGRCYELLHDNAKAKSTYDKITSQLPETEYAKTADLRKSQI